MRRVTHLTNLVLVVSCVFFAGGAAAGESSPYAQGFKPAPAVVHGYCYADASENTVYFTPAFSSATVGGPGGSTAPEALAKTSATMTVWQNAFQEYLSETYGARGLIRCALEDTLEKAQSSRQPLLDHFRRSNAGYTIKRTFVETDWAHSAP